MMDEINLKTKAAMAAATSNTKRTEFFFASPGSRD
jgi:hypothetical protein